MHGFLEDFTVYALAFSTLLLYIFDDIGIVFFDQSHNGWILVYGQDFFAMTVSKFSFASAWAWLMPAIWRVAHES